MNRTRKCKMLLLAWVGLWLAGSGMPCAASVASRTFSGVITGFETGYGFPGDFAVGNPFSITVVYDDSAPDITAHPNVGLFLLGPGSSISAIVRDALDVVHVFEADPTTTFALIYDDYDSINRLDFGGATNSDRSMAYLISLSLSDDGNQVIRSDQLSTIDLNGPWSGGYFEIASPFGMGGGGIFARLGPIPAVPEPSTYILTFAGLAVLGLLTRRRTGTRAVSGARFYGGTFP
jgi:hypothetical protein